MSYGGMGGELLWFGNIWQGWDISLTLIYQNQTLYLWKVMNTQEPKSIKIQIYHQYTGTQVFDIEARDSLSQFRNILTQTTPLALYQNYHFEHHAKQVPEYQQIGQLFPGDTQLKIVMDIFSERSSRYHTTRIKKIIKNPLLWAVINCKQPQQNNKFQRQQLNHHLELDVLLQKTLTSQLLTYHQSNSFQPLLNFINYSGFNPPPYYRKLAGDFYYLHISTLENIDYHITANPQGFFINQSTNAHFHPSPQQNKPIFSSLINLLSSISPKFKQHFNEVTRNTQVSELDKTLLSINNNQKVCQWLKQTDNSHQWSNDTHFKQNRQNHLDLICIKDWNELFQLQCVLPTDTILERLNKEKLKYKLYQQFIDYAKDGTISIVQGKILPYPPLQRDYLYVYGSLMYIITNETDQPHHNARPSSKIADCQLNNLGLVDKLGISQLHICHSVVIKYRGYKVIVQSIIPGVLGKDNDRLDKQQKDDFDHIVKKICKMLHISDEIDIVDKEGKIKKIVGHPQLQKILGNDKRKYITKLLKLSPRDYNYPGVQNQNCVLRSELIKLYTQKQKCSIPFNTILGTKLSTNLHKTQKLTSEQQKLKSVAKYVKQIVIPLCIHKFCNSMRKYLSDSKGVIYTMHQMGLGCRYLGLLYLQAGEENPHIKAVLERVIMVKSLKNLLRTVMRESDLSCLKASICKILNCIYEKEQKNQIVQQQDNYEKEDINMKKKKKKNKQKDDNLLEFNLSNSSSSKYLQMKSSELWSIIRKIALTRYSHNFPQHKPHYLSTSKFTKIALLRDLCINLGITLQKKQYFSDQFVQFVPSNILEFKPLYKSIDIECIDLKEIINEGDRMTKEFKVEQAIECYNRAMQYIMANFGGLHEKLGIVHKKISNIYFKIGQIDTALLFANHSCEIFENVYGLDHIQTIQNYTLLGFYNYSKRNFAQAEYFLLKTIHHIYCAYSQYYPQLIVNYLNLSTVYEGQKKYTDAIMSIIQALNLSIQIFGDKHIHVSICYSALATLHYQIPDIQQAIKYQLKVVENLSNVLKDDDLRLKESKSILQYYKNVQSSKKVKQIHEKQQKKLAQQLYNGMSLFKLPQPTFKEKEEIFARLSRMGKKKFY